MNFGLSQIPERTNKPRQKGMTMVMDKGLSIEEVKRFLSSSGSYVDVVKLGFGTAYVTPEFKRETRSIPFSKYTYIFWRDFV
jgi:phosphosulfolactate synthase